MTNIAMAAPSSAGFSWCLADTGAGCAVCPVVVETLLSVTVGSTWLVKLMPPLLVNKLLAVPCWTLPAAAALVAGPTDACGVCVFAWLVMLPLPALIDKAMSPIVKYDG